MFICPKCGGNNVGCLSYRDPMAYVEEQQHSEGETTDNCLKGDLETFKLRRKRECKDCGARFMTVECFERYLTGRWGKMGVRRKNG